MLSRAYSGYFGLAKRHANSRLPHKKSKLHPHSVLVKGIIGTEFGTTFETRFIVEPRIQKQQNELT